MMWSRTNKPTGHKVVIIVELSGGPFSFLIIISWLVVLSTSCCTPPVVIVFIIFIMVSIILVLASVVVAVAVAVAVAFACARDGGGSDTAASAAACAIGISTILFCPMEFAVKICWFSRLVSTCSCVAALANPISLNAPFCRALGLIHCLVTSNNL